MGRSAEYLILRCFWEVPELEGRVGSVADMLRLMQVLKGYTFASYARTPQTFVATAKVYVRLLLERLVQEWMLHNTRARCANLPIPGHPLVFLYCQCRTYILGDRLLLFLRIIGSRLI